MKFINKPYWESYRNLVYKKQDNIEYPSNIDVVIIGGGYTGLNAAIPLLKANLNVLVLEANHIGSGASGLNTGFITCEPINTQDSKLLTIPLKSKNYLIDLIKTHKIHCDLECNGSIKLATKIRHMYMLEKNMLKYNSLFGKYFTLLSSKELEKESSMSNVYGGLLNQLSCSLNPIKYIEGLVNTIKTLNGNIFEYSKVTNIEKQYSSYKVTINNQINIICKEVIVATDGEKITNSTNLVCKKSLTISSYVIGTTPISKDLQYLISIRKRNFFTTSFFTNYFKLTAEGNLLFGGEASFFQEDINTNLIDKLYSKLHYFFPFLKDIKIEYAWKGNINLTLNRIPFIGQDSQNMKYSFGYSGRGVSIASYYGHNLSQFILGKEYDKNIFSSKIPNLNPYHKSSFFLKSGYYYYKIKDFLF
ncbi:NAD(P)/FAD-dependent oxidoreductase [Candidatus Jidaibacter acanthamoebae]|nr:FAD-dependent oxidoreductase [Candidatus Jidaibacter acanthamoeba]